MSNAIWWWLVKFGFRLLYHEMAFTYDTVSWIVSLGEWRSWQRSVLKHLNVNQDDQVLELAHGTANLQMDLFAAGINSIALDFSPQMGAIARHKLIKQHVPYKLARARAQALPFGDAEFAAVVSTFPTNFIVDPATIAEVYRVLKPSGRLVFVPNGQLTGGGVARQGLEVAYRATGQHSAWPDKIQARFENVGFTLKQALEPCRISVAQIIIAQKA